MNTIFYSFLLYYIESYKQGINLFDYYFNRKRMDKVKKNYDRIVNEDSDVSDERARVSNSNLEVSTFLHIN